jgi:branched-chain amino acid transport system substrate-binding protein
MRTRTPGGSYENGRLPSSRRLVRRLSRCCLAALAVGGLATCRHPQPAEPAPQPALADSREAQRDFRSIVGRWLEASPETRGALEQPLRDFIRRYPSDDLGRPARVYLAWILIQRKELTAARELVARARSGPAGSVQDFAVVTDAAILIRMGKPDAALELLVPLQGKIIDPTERLVFGEQLVQAALGGRRWRRAVDSMLDWLAEAPPENRENVQAAIERLLSRIPVLALERALISLDQQSSAADQASARAPAREALRKALRSYLVRVALDRHDPELARRLIDSGPPTLRRGDTGAALLQLASSGAVAARVAGRTVGLLLSLASPATQRRSAEVAFGLSRALGLPAPVSRPDVVRLLTRDDGAGLEAALSGLAGDGAAILVAGVDAPSARAASAFAETAGIPVVVLHHLADVSTTGYTFVLGVDLGVTTDLLEQALVGPDGALPPRVD